MTAPTPDQRKAMVAAVFDRSSATYDQVGVDYFSVIGQRLVDRAAPGLGDRVLDVGCGRGAVTFPAAEAVGPQGSVVAIDLAPGMVERTAADAKERGLAHVTVRVGDAEAPDVEGPFDVVLAGLVVFFLPDPEAALRAYRGLLREGGTLGLTTFPPQPEGAWSDVAKVLRRYLPADAQVPAKPDEGPVSSPERLDASLRAAGFADVRIDTEGLDTTFRDADQWWEWSWSHGQRAAWERVPPEDLDSVRAECYALIEPVTAPDGSLTLPQLVTYTVAS